jgi:hypothetical protein
MYDRRRPHLYYGGKNSNTVCEPPSDSFLRHRGVALPPIHAGTQAVHKGGKVDLVV